MNRAARDTWEWGPARPTNPFIPFRDEDVERSVPDYFEEIVARDPSRRAVRTRTGELSYDQLNQRANRSARHLLRLRPDRDEPVALLFDHGAPAIAALLGALKSGKPYVALDPTYPLERLHYVLDRLGAGLLVHDGANAVLAEELAAAAGVRASDHAEADARYSSDNLRLPLAPDRACYVTFTSGSTGRPKGVIGTHRIRLANQRELVNVLRVGPDDRLTALHSIGFIASAPEIYGALLAGASVYPLDFDQEGFAGLQSWLVQNEITFFQWISSAFRRFAQDLPAGAAFPHLRVVLIGSEPVSLREVSLFRERFPQECLLVNRYGSTECGNMTFYVTDRSTPMSGATMPVGFAAPSKQIRLLAADGTPAAPGEVGEIVVTSEFLSPGYWGDPELTASRFQAGASAGWLTFPTGDLGRLDTSGCLEHLGRSDSQVKVRGYRIELTEIEAALLAVPGVRDAAAVAVPDAAGEPRLAGYVSAEPGAALTSAGVIQGIRGRLPEYMVPGCIIFLDALPLTPTGKIMRSALPAPVWEQAQSRGPYQAPETARQRAVAEMFEQVLGVRGVGLDDHFFELGGHSLQAVQLLAQIERAFGCALPLATLVHAPTVCALADRLDRPDAGAESVLVPFRVGGTRSPLFAVHGIGGGVLCYRELAGLMGDDQPFYGLQTPSLAGGEARHLSVPEMAGTYVAAMRRVQPAGPYSLLGLSFGGNLALEMAGQLHAAGESVSFLGLLDSRGPGYPRFVGRRARLAAHLAHFVSLPHAERRPYLQVRTTGLREQLRRRLLRGWLQRSVQRGASLPRLLEDVGISHLQAMRDHQPQPYPGLVTLFRAEQQPIGCIHAWDNGWSGVALGGVKVHAMPGEHASMIEAPHVSLLANTLTELLRGVG
jgi:amino acid adenylation domain-containing protein